jgi:hypothetical protein
VNTDEPWPDADAAWWRVLKIQTKLHQWATDDPIRRFDDLYNLVYDPAVLVDAWHRVKGNRGARSAGVDGQTAFYISAVRGVEDFLDELRAELKARTFRPMTVRERMIPKPGGKRRRLGIPTVPAYGPFIPTLSGFGFGRCHPPVPPADGRTLGGDLGAPSCRAGCGAGVRGWPGRAGDAAG